jgi:hypothetical protein
MSTLLITHYTRSLENLQWCSGCDPAQIIWVNKSQNVWLSKMVLAQHFFWVQFAEAGGERHIKTEHLPEKSALNVI